MKKYASPYLSDYRGGKVIVRCEKCGMSKQYDANTMLERIKDKAMPDLINDIARAEGCKKIDDPYSDKCHLRYDLEAMRKTL